MAIVKSMKRNLLMREAISSLDELIKLEKKKIKLQEDMKIALLINLMWEEAGGKGNFQSARFVPSGKVADFEITGEDETVKRIGIMNTYKPVFEKYRYQLSDAGISYQWQISAGEKTKEVPTKSNKYDFNFAT